MNIELVDALLQLGLAAIGFLTMGLTLFAAWLAKKSKQAWLDTLIFKVRDAVTVSVEFIAQTMVKEMKDTNGDGKLDKHEAKAAADEAFVAAKEHLGGKVWKGLVSQTGSEAAATEFVKREIEAAVSMRKDPEKKA